jgi:hypothetical protein
MNNYSEKWDFVTFTLTIEILVMRFDKIYSKKRFGLD